MSAVYVYVGAEANIGQVAVDLRNQAPTVLIVCCSDGDVTARMHMALRQEAVNRSTRGEGANAEQKGSNKKRGGFPSDVQARHG